MNTECPKLVHKNGLIKLWTLYQIFYSNTLDQILFAINILSQSSIYFPWTGSTRDTVYIISYNSFSG